MQKNGFRSEVFDDFGDDWLEDHLEAFVIKSFIEREVDSMIGARIFSDVIDVAGSWEVVLELVEGGGHDSIGQVEGFFNTVSVMDINIDVEHPLISFQKFQDSKHAIVDIAKS